MTFSDNDLTQIEKLASLFLKISDIAVALGLPPEVLRAEIADRNSDAAAAYRRGKTGSKIKMAAQVMQLANLGSPLAVETAQQNLLDMEEDE